MITLGAGASPELPSSLCGSELGGLGGEFAEPAHPGEERCAFLRRGPGGVQPES